MIQSLNTFQPQWDWFLPLTSSLKSRLLTQAWYFSMSLVLTKKPTTYNNSLILFYGGLFISNKQITGSLVVEITLSNL